MGHHTLPINKQKSMYKNRFDQLKLPAVTVFIAVPPSELKTHKTHMQKALQSIPKNPNPQRPRRPLLKRGEQHHHRHGDKRQVPYHVQHHNGLRETATAAATVAHVPVVVVLRSWLRAVPQKAMVLSRDQPRRVTGQRQRKTSAQGVAHKPASALAARPGDIGVHSREKVRERRGRWVGRFEFGFDGGDWREGMGRVEAGGV